MVTSPSTMTDTLFCTVDTSRVEEGDKDKAEPGAIRQATEEIRTNEGHESWRCVAVIMVLRNTARIRVTLVDNANRAAVHDQEGNLLSGVTESLGIENEVSIAKIAWLSREDIGKAYGSMVVYVTKDSDATRLLQGQYFHIA
jgi:hypothetical protein